MWQNGDSPDNGKGSSVCKQGTIDWESDENLNFFMASGLGCKPKEGKEPRKFHKGDEVEDCYDGPLKCPKKYDGSFEMCQDIALLNIYGQTDDIDMWFGNWITWNSEGSGCYMYDEVECDTLSNESKGDYSFQLCGEGYAPSKYQNGDKPDGSCDQGDLDDAGNPFFLAKGLGCKGDDSKMTKFHIGDKVPGCDDPDWGCVAVYDGTVDSCQSIGTGAVAGDNQVDYYRGGWISWNSDSQGCYIWNGECSEFSNEDNDDSSFQYCGMT